MFCSKTTVSRLRFFAHEKRRKVKRTFCASDSLCERKNFGTRGRRDARCVFSRILRVFEVRDVLVARESRTLSRRTRFLYLECALYFKRARKSLFFSLFGDSRDLEKRSKQRLREKKKRSRRVFVRALSMLFVGRVVGTHVVSVRERFCIRETIFFSSSLQPPRKSQRTTRRKKNVCWFSDAITNPSLSLSLPSSSSSSPCVNKSRKQNEFEDGSR